MDNSIKKNEEFRAIYQSGKSFANKYLVMYVKQSESETGRIGISVSKKSGKQCGKTQNHKIIKRELPIESE